MKLALDKQAHALSGAVIVFACERAGMSLIRSVLICITLGLAKEIYDAYHPDTHTCDGWDFVATISGGLLVATYITGVRLWM